MFFHAGSHVQHLYNVMKMENKIIVGRPINGISLNGLEWLLNDEGKPMQFNNKEKAIEFLRSNGHEDYTDDEIEDSFMFDELTEENGKKSN